jgi:acyl-CoA thioesterase-1
MLLIPSLLVVLLCAVAAPAAARERAAPPRIVVLGDSLTSGHGIGEARAFPSVLQTYLDENGYQFRVVNAGVSGDTTSGALRRFEAVLTEDVRVLVVALGVNDGLRGVAVDQVKRNLARIIEAAQTRGITVLLCGMEALPMYGWQYTVAFHQMYIDLARQYRVPLVPFMLINVIGNAEMMQADGVHPNAAGARAMATHIWPHLEPLVAGATPVVG